MENGPWPFQLVSMACRSATPIGMIGLGIVNPDSDVLLQAIIGIDDKAICRNKDAALQHLGRDVFGCAKRQLIITVNDIELAVIGLPCKRCPAA